MFFTLSKLPEGVYDQLEMQNVKEGNEGKFTGGLGSIMVVRYKDTPVGESNIISYLIMYAACKLPVLFPEIWVKSEAILSCRGCLKI